MAKKIDTNDIGLDELVEHLNRTFGADTVMLASASKAASVPRLTMNILPLDYCTGGGIPFGRITSIWGEESSGKSTLAQIILARAQRYCRGCLVEMVAVEDILACPECGGMEGLTAMYVDSERTWDNKWASALGVNLDKVFVISPEYAEQAADVADLSIRAQCDLLIIDTIAMLTPSDEIRDSASRWQQGLLARIMAKMLRKITSAMNRKGLSAAERPTVLLLNQTREKIGVFFGDPTTRPGGTAQRFASSLEIRTRGGKYKQDKDGNTLSVLISFTINKNKTAATAKMVGNFRLWLREHDGHSIGDTEEPMMVVKVGKIYGLIGGEGKKGKKGGAGTEVEGEKFKSEKQLVERLDADYGFYRKVRDGLLKRTLGNLYSQEVKRVQKKGE